MNFNKKLKVKGRYLYQGETPFFYLGDTAWLIFANLNDEEAEIYLKNRKAKDFNVIQACLFYASEDMEDITNKMPTLRYDIKSEDYWKHVDKVISLAEENGLYMGLLPCWGSIVKNGIINEDNIEKYLSFLLKKYGKRKNIIWIMGGDVKAGPYLSLYKKELKFLKEECPDQLVTYHPFGRTSSTEWFKDEDGLDFNMFQSGHRNYNQGKMNAWDDNNNVHPFFGEDNWRYVEWDYQHSEKPTLDAEPSYEWILQGLHDHKAPYWKSSDVRRYAYWSVFAGSCGHTYGDNAIIDFYKPGMEKIGDTYGALDSWTDSLHHIGSGEMQHLKHLMESVNYPEGKEREDLVIKGEGERYARVAVFASSDFLFAYSFIGQDFVLNTRDYLGKEIYFMNPVSGAYSYIGKVKAEETKVHHIQREEENKDFVVVIK